MKPNVNVTVSLTVDRSELAPVVPYAGGPDALTHGMCWVGMTCHQVHVDASPALTEVSHGRGCLWMLDALD